jgi:hypothetical protein
MPDWLNFRVIAAVAGALVFAVAFLSVVLKRLGVKIPASAVSWQSYLRGQGTILLISMLLGAAVGWVSIRFLGQPEATIENGVKLVDLRQTAIGSEPVYRSLDCSGYKRFSLYLRATTPQSSTVKIRIIFNREDQHKGSDTEITASDSAWSYVGQDIDANHILLEIGEPDSTGPRAAQADVLVFLSKR